VHGGFRSLKTFQLARLVYDVTAAFCDRYIDRRSRTHDQMVQAARSLVQNIAEGSKASGTSKSTEMRLTNVARASLEELRLDYEDFLRQRELPQWPPEHPALTRFKGPRCACMGDVQDWVRTELSPPHAPGRTPSGAGASNQNAAGTPSRLASGQPPASVPARTCESVSDRARPSHSVASAQLEANAALSLLNVCCHLLTRQLEAQAAAFEQEGGFRERLYSRRRAARHE